jgi:hypothetical protein
MTFTWWDTLFLMLFAAIHGLIVGVSYARRSRRYLREALRLRDQQVSLLLIENYRLRTQLGLEVIPGLNGQKTRVQS